MSDYREVHFTACHAGMDGDCEWKDCPQLRDGEPGKSGRHCPLDSERVILAFTRPGELVLDPFMGSGTTALACGKHGRRWVGVEENAPFIDMALERIERARRQPQLPLEAS